MIAPFLDEAYDQEHWSRTLNSLNKFAFSEKTLLSELLNSGIEPTTFGLTVQRLSTTPPTLPERIEVIDVKKMHTERT